MTTDEQKSAELQALEAKAYVYPALLAWCRRMEALYNLLAAQAAPQETTTDAPACEHHFVNRPAEDFALALKTFDTAVCADCKLPVVLRWVPAGRA